PEMMNLAVLDAVQQFTEDYSLRHRL
ncbi:MAG: hypothetical protein RL609_1481, partial [Bacteroidota bacterium]